MDTVEFLRLVWPSTGPYLIAIPIQWKDKDTGAPQKGYKHFAHDSVEAAANHAQALAWDSDQPHNVFFALGAIKERKDKGIRKADNIAALKCFWLDLDVKADLNAYATQQEAAAQLRAFCQSMQLPKPYVTSSGGGFHVYWPLATSIDGDKWKHYAELFKAVTKAWGLLADMSRTADRASVLRPVGTYNLKTDTPREVKLVMSGVVNNTDAFLQLIARMADTAGVRAPIAPSKTTVDPSIAALVGTRPDTGTSTINAAAASGLPSAGYTEADPKRVVERCQQLTWQMKNQAQVDQPSWYAMVSVMRLCQNGAKAAHRMSSRHPEYDAAAVDAKLVQLETGSFGPALCKTFENHRPGGCAGCPHAGKIKSPIVLGRQMLPVAAPKVLLQLAQGEVEVELPEPPAPYKRAVNPETNQARIVYMEADEDNIEVETVVYDFDLYPSKLIYDERNARFNVVVNRWLPHDGWGEFQIPTGQVYDRRSLTGTLGNAGVMPDLPKMDLLVGYMIGYIRELQRKSKATTIYAQLGWRGEDTFVLPDAVIHPDRVEVVQPSANLVKATQWDRYPPRGDLEAWKRVVATYERPNMEGFQFGFGVGFAAPLFHMSGHSGVVVNMVGQAGSGKTTAALCANSIWGHQKLGWLDMRHDTQLAFWGKIGALCNLPVTYDEITNLDGEDVSDLCYAITKGQGRQRMGRDGDLRENHGNWQTMLLSTSNSSLHATLSGYKSDAQAESVRVFEYWLPSQTMTKADADATFRQLETNYGLAGQHFMVEVVRDYEAVRARVHHWMAEIDRRAGVSSSERFWSAAPACVLAAFEVANRVGLTNADIERLAAFSVDVINRMRGTVSANVATPTDALAEYLNSNLRSVLSLRQTAGNGPLMVDVEPSSELRVRIEQWSNRVFIDRAHFRKFCIDTRQDASRVQQELKQNGALLEVDRRVVLGKGTKYNSAQVVCWVLDLRHPVFGHTAVAVVPNPNAATAAP